MIRTHSSSRQYLVVLVVLFGCSAKNEKSKGKKTQHEGTKRTATPSDAAPANRTTADGGIASRKPMLWTFSADHLGKEPKGITGTKGAWHVQKGPKAGMLVLIQSGRNPNPFFNVALFDKRYKDVDMSVRLRSISGKHDRGGGLVWRAKDTANYYIARYNPLENNYRLYKVVKGKRKQLASANTKGNGSGWRTVRIVATGDRIQCYLGGKKLLDHRDKTFGGSGYVGVWTKADAVTMFWKLTANGRE